MTLRSLALLVCAAVALAACADEPAAEAVGIAGKDVQPLEADLLPDEMLGLSVGQEDVVEPLTQVKATYVDALSVYSFRRKQLLQATLQVSRFGEQSAQVEGLHEAVVAQVGGASPKRIRVGDQIVHLTSGTDQNLSIWFRDDYFFVLAVRQDYERPRTLLRRAIAVEP